MHPDGQDRRVLEAAPGCLPEWIIGTPNISWSPDGERIATVVSGGTGTTIALVETVAGSFTPLDIEALGATFVAWSPDGQWLAYVGQWVGGEVFLIRRMAPKSTPSRPSRMTRRATCPSTGRPTPDA